MKKTLAALFGPDPITTVIGLLAGVALYAADAIKALPDIGPGWQAIAAILVIVGRAVNTRKAPPAAVLALLVGGSLLFGGMARADDPLPAKTSVQIGTYKAKPITLTSGVGLSGAGYDFGTKSVFRNVTISGLEELAFGDFPVALLAGGGFQAGESQGLAVQAGPEYRPLNVAVLGNVVVVGSTKSYGIVAGYVVRF